MAIEVWTFIKIEPGNVSQLSCVNVLSFILIWIKRAILQTSVQHSTEEFNY